ncbi:hypothetical protein QUB56_24545, partial [Microcoleus sp. AR_TQ3_B6]
VLHFIRAVRESKSFQVRVLGLFSKPYLEAEKVRLIKHEYRQGEIYARAGASKPHAIITGNVL